jgi:hypothetical protein
MVKCEFKFKCPKAWNLLQPTHVDGIRHCPACDRDVHLAVTEEDFRTHAIQGHCVAVPLQASAETAVGTDASQFVVGLAGTPYGSAGEQ